MRFYDPAVHDLLNSGRFELVKLLWVEARNGPIGMSGSEDAATYTLDGQTRLYAGTHGTLVVPNFRAEIGLSPISYSISVAAGIAVIDDLVLRGDILGVPCAVDYAVHDPETGALAGYIPRFRGYVEGPGWARSEDDAPSYGIGVVSRLVDLDRKVDLRKTDEDQSGRQTPIAGGPDRFRRYGTTAEVEAE